MKGYRWCSTCRVGHPIAESPCEHWLTAVAGREALQSFRWQEWRRARNRAGRYRYCLVCNRKFNAGLPRRGRPQELCSAACQEIRELDMQNARRTGAPVRRKPKHGLRTRGVLRISPVVQDFFNAFPDGWSVTDQLTN